MLDLPASLPLGLRLVEVQRIWPKVATRPATVAETPLLQPWFGPEEAPFDVAVFADGRLRHAPETLLAARQLLARAQAGVSLLYRHRGVQANPIDPLLPHLLAALDHSGPVHALRASDAPGEDPSDDPSDDPATLALLAAMTPQGGCTLLLDDHQSRVAPHGRLMLAPVVLSLFHMPPFPPLAGVQRS